MNGKSILDALSKRTPSIIALTLFATLVADWLDAPVFLPRGLAILVASLALILFAAGGRRPIVSMEDQEFESGKSWLAYELAGKGTPGGFYTLAFFVIVTIVLTGVESAYSLPAWAALFLGLAWGRANASFPLDEE